MKIVFRDDDGAFITSCQMDSVPRNGEMVNLATYPATGVRVHTCTVLYTQYNTQSGHARPIEVFVSGWGKKRNLLENPNIT
jgi:hypothetical protein